MVVIGICFDWLVKFKSDLGLRPCHQINLMSQDVIVVAHMIHRVTDQAALVSSIKVRPTDN